MNWLSEPVFASRSSIITTKIKLSDSVTAPVKKGDKIGENYENLFKILIASITLFWLYKIFAFSYRILSRLGVFALTIALP